MTFASGSKMDRICTFALERGHQFTVTNLTTVVMIPKAGFPVKIYLGAMMNQIIERFSTGSSDDINETCGMNYVRWLKYFRPGLYEHQMVTHPRSTQKAVTKEELAKKFNKGFANLFGTHSSSCDNGLDKHLCHYEMKAFLKFHCGYDSFNGVPMDLRKCVFSRTNGQIPQNWNEVEQEQL